MIRNRIVSNLCKNGINRIDNFLRKRSLLKNIQILLQLLNARSTNNDSIAILGGKSTVVRSPSQCSCVARDVVLGSDFSHSVGGSLDAWLDIL